MKQYIQKDNYFINVTLIFTLLSLIGSFLSVLNFISLVISYQLIQEAKTKELHYLKLKITQFLFYASIFLTSYMTFYYATIS